MKPRRLLGWLVVACIVFVVGLAAANVVDYVQFHRAVAGAILKGHVSPFTLTSRRDPKGSCLTVYLNVTERVD